MEEVSLVFHKSDTDFAHSLRNELQGLGFVVCTGPNALEGSRRYNDIRHHTQLSNASNIVLMSKNLYRENREYVRIFAEKIDRDWRNIHVVSTDDEWLNIRAEEIESLKSASFLPLAVGERSATKASAIAKAIKSSIDDRRDRVSHFDRQSFVDLLRGLFGSVKVLAEEDIKKAGICFSVCECLHPSGEAERYLAIYPSATLQAVSKFLEEYHPGILKDSARAYVVRSDAQSELSVKQKEVLKDSFDATPLRFEEMVVGTGSHSSEWDQLSDGEILVSQDWRSLNNPLSSTITTEGLISSFDPQHSVYRQNSIVLLTGPGGAGKTHFVRYLHDHLKERGREVFFLTAHSVRLSEPDLSISSLFDIYRLSGGAGIQKPAMPRELFDLTFCVSDPVIIVDGLEEIITMLGDRFRINEFFDDCRMKAEQLANGRIVVTTREQSWPLEIDSYADEFELELFDKAKTEEYFRKFFPDDPARASIASKIFAAMNDGEDEAPPLICKLVATELDDDTEVSIYQSMLDQGRFTAGDGLGGLIEGFISRERKLGVEWPIPSINDALGRLAVEAVAGPVDFEVSRKIIESAFSSHIPSNLGDAIRNFILLKFTPESNSITFRYDFVQTLFLANHILKCIEEIDTSIFDQEAGVALFARRLMPGSDVSRKIISTQPSNLPEDFFDILDQIIKEVSEMSATGNGVGSAREFKQIASNLLFLRLNADRNCRNIHDFTRVMKSIFGDSGLADELRSISIIRFDQSHDKSIKFSVTGMRLVGCWFEDTSIDHMLECDQETTFANSDFVRAISDRPSTSATIWTAIFEKNCRLGPRFEAMLSSGSAKHESSYERKVAELTKFLSLFSKANGHSFQRWWKKDSLFGKFKSSYGYGADFFVAALKKQKLIERDLVNRGDRLQLTSLGQRVARDLVLDSVLSKELKCVIEEMD